MTLHETEKSEYHNRVLELCFTEPSSGLTKTMVLALPKKETEKEEYDVVDTPSYKTQMKHTTSSLSEEECKKICMRQDVKTIVQRYHNLKDETTTFREKIINYYDEISEEECKTLYKLREALNMIPFSSI